MKLYTHLLIIVFLSFSCKEKNQIESVKMSKEIATVIIPFLPSSCHQCNDEFYSNLNLLEENNIEFSILLSEDNEDEFEYIREEYNLKKYRFKDYLFSTSLFDLYHIYEQNYVLQYGVDSNYIVFDNAKELIKQLNELNNIEKIDLDNHTIKKSTFNITINGKEQIFVKNSVRQDIFDFINLKSGEKSSVVSFTEEQLINNYKSNFGDASFGVNKLNEVSKFKNIPNKNVFDQGVFFDDTLFVFSTHTYISNIVDSSLAGFMTLNIYKDGKYLGCKPIDNRNIPNGYMFMPQFHFYKNKLYLELVKSSEIGSEQPNYFIGMFEWEGDVFRFKKILKFTVPPIHSDVGYSFLDLRFSGKYLMTSISNQLFNLENEEVENLNIPINEKFDFNDLASNCKGVNIVIDNINVQYPDMLITYFSKDAKGIGTTKILNYDLQKRKIVGKIQMPLDNSRFIKPDLTKFGYFMWTPKNGVNDYLIYKKLY